VLLTVAFIGWELRADTPMMPMRLFRSRALSSGIAASFLFYAAMYGTLFLLPQFFQGCGCCVPIQAARLLVEIVKLSDVTMSQQAASHASDVGRGKDGSFWQRTLHREIPDVLRRSMQVRIERLLNSLAKLSISI